MGALEDDAVVPEVMTLQRARARVGLEDLYASGSELLELATVLQLSEQPPTSCACADRYERLALTDEGLRFRLAVTLHPTPTWT